MIGICRRLEKGWRHFRGEGAFPPLLCSEAILLAESLPDYPCGQAAFPLGSHSPVSSACPFILWGGNGFLLRCLTTPTRISASSLFVEVSSLEPNEASSTSCCNLTGLGPFPLPSPELLKNRNIVLVISVCKDCLDIKY